MALFAAGCKGCAGGDAPAASPAAEPLRTELDRLADRAGSLKIDLSKAYPKRADGVVECGTDADCFVVMAHRCEPAVLDNAFERLGYVGRERIHALYRIAGEDDGKCRVLRLVLSRDFVLPDTTRDALLKQGKTAAQVEKLHADALAALVTRTPDRMVCPLSKERALSLALDLSTKKPTDQYFREPCHPAADIDAWPADFVAPPPAAQ